MKNGSGSIRKTTELTPLEEYDKYVAFYDLDKVKKSENNIQLTGKVRARYMGQIVEVDANKIQYMDLFASFAIWLYCKPLSLLLLIMMPIAC